MPVLIAFGIAIVVVAIVLVVEAVVGRSRTQPKVDSGSDGLVHDVVVEEVERHPALRRFLLARRDPTRVTGLLLTIALAFVTVLVLAVGLVLEMVQTNQGFARWDQSAARWGAAHTNGALEEITRVATQLGSTPVVVVVAIGVSLLEFRRIPTRAVPAFMLAVVVSELAVNNLIKFAVGRERPNVARLVHASGSSFPSGHTAATAAVYAAVALVVSRRRGRGMKWALAIAAGVMTVVVGASRVLLGAHWLTDVIAGSAVGWTCFALCSIAFGGRLLQFGEPVEVARQAAVESTNPTEPDGSLALMQRPHS